MFLAFLILTIVSLSLLTGCSSISPIGGTGETRAAIIDQLSLSNPNPAFIDQATAGLQKLGFKVDCFQGNQINVDFYRQLPRQGYQLLLFRVHSGVLTTGHKGPQKTCLFTNQPYNQTAEVIDQTADRLVGARVDEGKPVFSINADFVSQSMQAKFERTVVIMMGCDTFKIEDMAKAFIEKGASVYFGWTKDVGLDYVEAFTLSLLDNLSLENASLGSALKATQRQNGTDPVSGAETKYYPEGTGNKTITGLLK